MKETLAVVEDTKEKNTINENQYLKLMNSLKLEYMKRM